MMRGPELVGFFTQTKQQYPRHSMYGIFTCIWLISWVNCIGKYTIHWVSGYLFNLPCKNYFTSTGPHHDRFETATLTSPSLCICQVRVVRFYISLISSSLPPPLPPLLVASSTPTICAGFICKLFNGTLQCQAHTPYFPVSMQGTTSGGFQFTSGSFYSGILSGISPDMIPDVLSNIPSDTLSYIFWHFFLTFFWHIFWQVFWHSFWHIFWTSQNPYKVVEIAQFSVFCQVPKTYPKGTAKTKRCYVCYPKSWASPCQQKSQARNYSKCCSNQGYLRLDIQET